MVTSSHVDGDEGDEDDGKMARRASFAQVQTATDVSRIVEKALEERERERGSDGDDDILVGD